VAALKAPESPAASVPDIGRTIPRPSDPLLPERTAPTIATAIQKPSTSIASPAERTVGENGYYGVSIGMEKLGLPTHFGKSSIIGALREYDHQYNVIFLRHRRINILFIYLK
jgi:hypothetical protein